MYDLNESMNESIKLAEKASDKEFLEKCSKWYITNCKDDGDKYMAKRLQQIADRLSK